MYQIVEVPIVLLHHEVVGRIFFIFMIGIAALYFCKLIDRHWVLPLLLGCPIVTIVGFMDDKRSLPAGFRLVVHLLLLLVVIGITDGFEIGLVTDFIP